MAYDFTRLSDNLVYVRLTSNPTPEDDRVYLQALEQLLTQAQAPLYFLIDFRLGITSNIATIRKLADLAQKPTFGNSVAFASDHVKTIYSDVFSRLAGVDPEMPHDAQQAIALLEKRHAGVTQGIDWEAILE